MAFPVGRFYEDFKIVPIAVYASGTADRNSEVIDTAGYGGCIVIVTHAAVGNSGAYDIFLAGADAASDENTLTTGTNIATSSQTVADADDNTIKYIEFIPHYRYYQVTFNKDAATTYAESAIAILFNAKARPVTQAGGTSTIGDGAGAVTGEWLGLAVAGTK